MIKTLEQNVLARCSSLFSYVFTLMTARGSNSKLNCILFRGTTMSEVNYFRACWGGSAYRNEQYIPENRWKRVTGKYLHEPVLLVSTRLVNYLNSGSRFVPVTRAGKPALSVRAPLLCTRGLVFMSDFRCAEICSVPFDWRGLHFRRWLKF